VFNKEPKEGVTRGSNETKRGRNTSHGRKVNEPAENTVDWNLRKYFMNSEAGENSNSEITFDLCSDQPTNHSNETD
jgi:hypothetical protein